jgi:hypothetical protein
MLPAVLDMRERFITKAAEAAEKEAEAAAAPPPPLPPPPPGWQHLEVVLRRTEGMGFGLDIADDNEIGDVLKGSNAEAAGLQAACSAAPDLARPRSISTRSPPAGGGLRGGARRA